MKKFLSLLLAFSLALSLAACGGSASSAVSGSAASSEAASSEAASSEAAQELSTTDALRIAGLKGPTTMGLVNLLSMEQAGTAAMDYDLQLYGAADEIVPLLIKGELDMAAIPANLAATLYQKTNGGIQAVAVNTLGVLYVVEQGDTVHSMADLKGRTILSTGKGTTPEYVLRYLLTANGLDPDKDVDIQYYSEATEVTAQMASTQDAIAVLPQPYVTDAGLKDGTIDVIATDHAPHHEDEKRCEFHIAASGISGFETAFCISNSMLVKSGRMTLPELIERMSVRPAALLGVEGGRLSVGCAADVVVFDPDKEIVVDASRFLSRGKNTPFDGKRYFGEIELTLVGGKAAYQAE